MDYKQTLNRLIDLVVKQGASDLHISEGRKPILRVADVLIPLTQEKETSAEEARGILAEMINAKKQEVFLTKKEVDFAYNHENKIRFRGNAFFQQKKVGIALRLVPSKIRTLEELNLPEQLELFTKKKQGFFLCVGPTGQGKSTTLAALVEIINKNRLEHIITIEDPIEYVFTPKKSIIDQREIGEDTLNFHDALTGVFRQDADVVMIGEMRGTDTMETAVTAAETGHLVMSTLHTNNASQTIDRIIDSFPGDQQDQIRLQLAASLTGIFSQRLIPRVSGGLVPAYELLIANTAVRNLIRENRTHEIPTVVETSSEDGMVDMNRTLAELVRAGEITVEDAYAHSTNSSVLERML